MDLNLVRFFVAVHEAGSFSAAAGRLGVPRSTVSRAVFALEKSLGVLLFHRSTRQVTTTAAGVAIFERVAPSLGALEASLLDLPGREEVPTGTLHVTSTAGLGVVVLAEAALRFTARYPSAHVELHFSNKLVDLVQEGMDLALRVTSRPAGGSSIVSRKVGSISIQLYASPSYLARRGTPRSPADLADHDWIAFRGASPMQITAAEEQSLVGTRPRVTCDEMFVAREMLRMGGGIGSLPSFGAEADLAAGTLVRVLPRWKARSGTVFLLYPSRQHPPRKLTVFRDLLAEMLRQRPLISATDADP